MHCCTAGVLLACIATLGECVFDWHLLQPAVYVVLWRHDSSNMCTHQDSEVVV
jgi:hypothetical protein